MPRPAVTEAVSADQRPYGTAEMRSPFAPIETGTAQHAARSPRSRKHRPSVKADSPEKLQTRRRQQARLVRKFHQPLVNQGVGHGYPESAREVIVASAGSPECCFPWVDSEPRASWFQLCSDLHEAFQHPCH